MAFAGSKPPELFAQPKGDALIEGILSASVETTVKVQAGTVMPRQWSCVLPSRRARLARSQVRRARVSRGAEAGGRSSS